ncbi:MAG: hypothetical protein Q7S84_04875 [bacterium]|nr:hypothetical protein [bacterium]
MNGGLNIEGLRKLPVEELKRVVTDSFNGLSDREKVEVMQEIVRRVLLYIKTARDEKSTRVAFNLFVGGKTFEEVVIKLLEAISGWSDEHTNAVHHRAGRIHDIVEEEMRYEIIKSPTLQFRHLKKYLLGGGAAVAGFGLVLVAKAIYRAKRRRDADAAHE